MTRGLFGWPPFKLIAFDADTGKPVGPKIGRATYVTYYDVKKDKNGNKSVVAHRSPAPSVNGDAEKVTYRRGCLALVHSQY